MKILFLLLTLFTLTSFTTFAQCDKKLLLTSSVTEHLDSSGTIQRTMDENTTIEISKTEIVIAPSGDEHKITGPIKSHECNWSTPYKEGKSVIKAELTDPGGQTMHATITITGKDGKVTLLFQIAEMPDRKIRVTVEKFEEVK